jgi:hypothetical protein
MHWMGLASIWEANLPTLRVIPIQPTISVINITHKHPHRHIRIMINNIWANHVPVNLMHTEAATAKCQKWLWNKIAFLTVLKTNSPKSRYHWDLFLLRPLSMAFRCQPSPSNLTSSSLFACTYVYIQVFSSFKDNSQKRQDNRLMTGTISPCLYKSEIKPQVCGCKDR